MPKKLPPTSYLQMSCVFNAYVQGFSPTPTSKKVGCLDTKSRCCSTKRCATPLASFTYRRVLLKRNAFLSYDIQVITENMFEQMFCTAFGLMDLFNTQMTAVQVHHNSPRIRHAEHCITQRPYYSNSVVEFFSILTLKKHMGRHAAHCRGATAGHRQEYPAFQLRPPLPKMHEDLWPLHANNDNARRAWGVPHGKPKLTSCQVGGSNPLLLCRLQTIFRRSLRAVAYNSTSY